MTVLFEGVVHLHYGFIFVLPPGMDQPDLIGSRGGQVNGLCGAASTGALALVTGLHTGAAPLRVECVDSAPDMDAAWEDAVEVSFHTDHLELSLWTFDHAYPFVLPGVGDFRVRYCAAGMDAARRQDCRLDGDPILDRYLLQFWPAPAAADAIVRQSSELAGYWHSVARETQAPPTEAELANAVRAAPLREQEVAVSSRGWDQAASRLRWGSLQPTAELVALDPDAARAAQLDLELAETIVRLPAEAQRRLAVQIARLAVQRAGPGPLDWSVALDALDAGRALPRQFDDNHAWRVLFPGSTLTATVHTVTDDAWNALLAGQPAAPPAPLSPDAAALAAVLSAAGPEPAQAALGAVADAASAASDQAQFLEQVRQLIANPSAS